MADTATKSPGNPRKKQAAERASEAFRSAGDTAKRKADDAVHATTRAIDDNPFSALAGAIAAGAVAAAMIPATRRELEAFGPWAERMREALSTAFDAAKNAGTGELTAAGLTLAAASDGVGGVLGKIVKAATVATTAAATSVKDSRRGDGSSTKNDEQSTPETSDEPVATQA